MRSSDVTIIASGWSVRNVAIDRTCGVVIGVNDAAIRAPRIDRIVSMDRLWTEYRWEGLRELKLPTWLRRSAVQNVPRAEHWPALSVFDCDNESSDFSTDRTRLNGTNSGFCALNLAYQMRPARVFLLGFDMNRDKFGRAYWHDTYPWAANGGTKQGKYETWAGQFKAAARAFADASIDVFNVSPASAIPVFPKITPAQYMRECK